MKTTVKAPYLTNNKLATKTRKAHTVDEYPHDTETERRLLGALLVAPVAVRDEIAPTLDAALFWDEWHQWLLEGLCAARRLDNRPLLEYLYSRRRASWHNLDFFLGLLLTNYGEPTTCGRVANIENYIGRLQSIATKRQAIIDAQNALNEAYDDAYDCISQSWTHRSRTNERDQRRPSAVVRHRN